MLIFVSMANPRILVEKDGFQFLVYQSSIRAGHTPTIMTAVDKNSYAKFLLKGVHGDTYDYSKLEYISSDKHYITIGCKKHGFFEQRFGAHYQGQICKQCSLDKKRMLFSDFILKAKSLHNNFFSYPNPDKEEYVPSTQRKVVITCPLHGDFKQIPQAHLKGQGCSKCRYMLNNKRFSDWIQYRPTQPGIFYILKCWNDEELFYKVGITTKKSVKKRFQKAGGVNMPYNYEVILEEVSMDKRYIWDKEIRVKKENVSNHYIPTISFNGSKTECFKTLQYDFKRNANIALEQTKGTV